MTIRIADFYKRRLIIEALLRYSYDLSKRPNGEALQRDILDLAWEIDDRLALVVEAELIHEFCRNGARAPAYGSIVAAGANACVLHYRENSAVLRKGDLVQLDRQARRRAALDLVTALDLLPDRTP